MPRRITEKVETLVSRECDKQDELGKLFDRLHDSYDAAEKASRKNVLLIFLVWFLAIAIDVDLIQEGSASSFKISNLREALIAAPPLLALVHYLLATTTTTAGRLRYAIATLYKLRLPTAYDEGLHLLLGPPSFLSTERYLAARRDTKHILVRAGRVWSLAWVVSIPIFALLASGHLCVVIWRPGTLSLTLQIVSTAVTVLFSLRSVLVWFDFDP